MRRELCIDIPFLPPSENAIWVHRRGGGQAYTAAAEEFRRKFQTLMRRELILVTRFVKGHRNYSIYRLTMVLHMTRKSILNEKWLQKWKSDTRATTLERWAQKQAQEPEWKPPKPHKAGDRKALSPYKMMDTGNRRKLVEDCLARALTIDDSLNFAVEMTKVVSSDWEGIRLSYEEEDPRLFGIPEEFLV